MRGLCVTIFVVLTFALVVYGIKCRYCIREEPHKGCRTKVSECHTKPGSTCISINVYHRGVMQYRMEGCAYKLVDCRRKMAHRRIGYNVNVTCCATHDFCNHWDHDEDD